MQLRKYRWSRDYESAEEELIALFAVKQIAAERWTLETGQILSDTTSGDSRIWCAEGSIMYTVNGKRFSLQPGDTLEIPANHTYDAVAGISGTACYQATVASNTTQ